MSTTTKKSMAQLVHEVILDDPGVSASDIQERLDNITGRQVSNTLNFLRRTDKIQNLGRHAKGARWFPAD